MNKNKEHRYHELVMHGPCTCSVPAVAVEDIESVLNSFDFCKCILACVRKAWRFRVLENIKRSNCRFNLIFQYGANFSWQDIPFLSLNVKRYL